MTRLFFALCASLFLATAAPAQEGKQNFILVNKTGYDIKEIYVSPSKSNNWEEDVLGDNTLEDDESFRLSFSRNSTACMWDLKVVYEEDDSSAVWTGIDLCKVSKVTIHWNKKTEVTTADFE